MISLIKRYKKCIVKQKDNALNLLEKSIKNTNEIVIELYIIIIYNSLFSFSIAFTILLESNEEKVRESGIYVSILFTKFFIFVLNYYCVNITKDEESKELLLSQSTLITIYLMLSDEIISIINLIFRDIIGINIYIIQTVFSFIILIIIILSNFLCCLKIGGDIMYFGGVCLCLCCCCNKDNLSNSCYCQYCDSICSYSENCKCWICEYCNN